MYSLIFMRIGKAGGTECRTCNVPVEQINTHEDKDMEQSPRCTVALMGTVYWEMSQLS